MAINLTNLKNELTVDPLNIGYSDKLNVRNDMGLCDLINEIREGSEYLVSRGRITKDNFIEVTSLIIFNLMQESRSGNTDAEFWLQVFDRLVANSETVNSEDPVLNSILDQMISSNLITSDGKSQVIYRQGSRAEKLFGQVVTLDQISNSLNEVNE